VETKNNKQRKGKSEEERKAKKGRWLPRRWCRGLGNVGGYLIDDDDVTGGT